MKEEKFRGLVEESALELVEEEFKKMEDEIGLDLTRARKILDLDLEGVSSASNISDMVLELREDLAKEGFERNEALGYAKESHYGYFEIKRVID